MATDWRAVRDALGRLVTGAHQSGKHARFSIPVRPTDDDVIVSNAIASAQAIEARLETLRRTMQLAICTAEPPEPEEFVNLTRSIADRWQAAIGRANYLDGVAESLREVERAARVVNAELPNASPSLSRLHRALLDLDEARRKETA